MINLNLCCDCDKIDFFCCVFISYITFSYHFLRFYDQILDDHELHAMTYRGGTFQYFSPERRSGNPFNEKDDIWAVGCLIVELVIGKFISSRSGCGASGVDFANTPAKVAAVVAEVEEVSARCGRLVRAILLQRDPSTRPTAAQLLQRSEFW